MDDMDINSWLADLENMNTSSLFSGLGPETLDMLRLRSSTTAAAASAMSPETGAEIVESVKRGVEASMPGMLCKIEETLRIELQASIPALVEREFKKQSQAIPGLVEEAVKRVIPELVLSMIKEGQIMTSSVPRLPTSQPLFHHNFVPPLTSRSFPQQAESSNSRILHLKFEGNLPKETFTKDNLKDQGASLNVELRDQSGNKVDVGPESSAQIKIFVVDGDFKVKDGLSEEDLSKHEIKPREGKGPLLKGKYEPCLSNGVASVSEIAFTDNSKSMRNGKFRLAAQALGVSSGVAIKGAVSDNFPVKEYRNTFNRKRETLSLDDEVWNLVNIGKGKILGKLQKKGVHSVKDLLQLNNNDPKELLQIFRGHKKNFKETIEMAKSCCQPGQLIQPQEMLDNSQKELSSGNSLDSAFGKQMEMPKSCSAICQKPMPSEDLCLPSSSVNMYLNVIGSDQGMMPYQLGEATYTIPGHFPPSPGFGVQSVEDYDSTDSKTRCYSPRWNPVRAVLRFKIAVKVSVKEGPRAGKRQKRG